MKKWLKMIGVLWMISFILVGAYFLVKVSDYYEQYDIYYDLAIHNKKHFDMTNYHNYLNVFYFIKKINFVITTFYYYGLSFLSNVLLSRRIKIKNYQHFPRIVHDYKLYKKLEHIITISNLITLLLFINIHVNLDYKFQLIIFFLFFLIQMIILYSIIKKKTHNVIKRIKEIQKNGFQDVSNDELEIPKENKRFNRTYRSILGCFILVTLFLSIYTVYQLKTYVNSPEVIIITDDFEVYRNDRFTKTYCTNSDAYIYCYPNYEKIDFFERYYVKTIKITIHDETILDHIESGDYMLIINQHNILQYVNDGSSINNQFILEFDDQNLIPNSIFISLNQNDQYVSIPEGTIEFEMTLIRK